MSVTYQCRTCGKRVNRYNSKNIFNNDNTEILQKLQALTGLWLIDDLNMPKKMCAFCILDLDHAIGFRKRCLKMHNLLLRNLGEIQSMPKSKVEPLENSSSKDIDNDPLASDNDNVNDAHVKVKEEDAFDCEASEPALADKESLQMLPAISMHAIQKTSIPVHNQPTLPSFHQTRAKSSVTVTPKSHRQLRRYICEQCGRNFEDRPKLTRHMKRHLNDLKKDKLTETAVESKQAFSASVPATHTSHSIPKISIQMHKQNEALSSSIQEERTHATGGTSLEAPKKIWRSGNYFCDQCGRQFNDKANLNRHVARHLGVKKFECGECGHKDFSQHLINLHKRIQHQGEKPYACKYCGERFANSMARLRHQRNHKEYLESLTELPSFACKLCDKTFRKKSILDVHAVVHTGEQPFCCEVCNVHFNRKSSLRAHYRSKFHQNNVDNKLDQTGVDFN